MVRPTLPSHRKLDYLSPARIRAPIAQRLMWREVAAEAQLTETAFARISIVMLMRALAKTNRWQMRRAVKRANRQLLRLNMPPVTLREILSGDGLPEYGLLNWTLSDQLEHRQLARAQLNSYQRLCRSVAGLFMGDKS